MRAHERLAGELVERAGEPLREPPAVDEDQRRAVRADQLEQPRMDRRPDRRPRVGRLRRRPARDVVGRRQPRHVLDRHFDASASSGFFCAGVDDGDRAGSATRRGRRRIRRAISRPHSASRLARSLRGLRAAVAARRRAVRLGAAEEPRDLVERPLRRREADALRRPSRRAPRAARARARGARRAWSAPARGSRR